MKNKALVIFGTGDIAQLANYYFGSDSKYDVVAFTVDKEFCTVENFDGKPLIDFDDLEKDYGPKDVDLFIAISYARMNKLREEKCNIALKRGYNLASYVSSRCSYLSKYKPGYNSFIFEDNTIQPFVKIGDNVTIWSGNHIGHHSIIESHNFISSHVVISGHCLIKSHCFLGVNSTIAHKVTLEKETLVGAGAIITKNTKPKGVYVGPRSVMIDKTSDKIKM